MKVSDYFALAQDPREQIPCFEVSRLTGWLSGFGVRVGDFVFCGAHGDAVCVVRGARIYPRPHSLKFIGWKDLLEVEHLSGIKLSILDSNRRKFIDCYELAKILP